MMVWVPGNLTTRSDDQRITLGRIVAALKGGLAFISGHGTPGCPLVHCVFRRSFQSCFHIVPCGISGMPGFRSGSAPGKSAAPASVAGEGVVGPSGPRTGNSSGALPGNSCGCGGAPGSRIGGGTSGRGLPGGSSCGGSAGLPGVAGGISGGSTGICIATLRLSPISDPIRRGPHRARFCRWPCLAPLLPRQ
jgi:hypothetical protein